jgi:signal transduction histidine kinase
MQYPEVIFAAVKRVSSSLSTAEVLATIVESAAQSLRAKGCALLLLTPGKKELVHSADYGLSDRYVKKGPLAAGKSLAKALKGQPVLALHADRDKNVQYRQQAKREGIASILSVPVTFEDEVIGVLRIYTAEPRRFSDEEISFLEGLAGLGALALKKAEVHEATTSDLQQCNIDLSQLENERQTLFRFLSMATHDLKAPLAAVQTYFSVMTTGLTGPLNEKQLGILARCSTRVNELLELVSDLLDIPKIESGHILAEMETVRLKGLVDDSLEVAAPLGDKKGVTLKLDIPRRLPSLQASGSRLKQVLTHLLCNAISYSHPGGTVKLKIINGRQDFRFEVSDDGIGIPDDELSQVFNDFFRASTNVEARGTGLGLSIAKRVVEAHGGRIWAESPCPGTYKGSRFTFTIPKKAVKNAGYESGH